MYTKHLINRTSDRIHAEDVSKFVNEEAEND